jgi:hypothetical protein
MDQSGVRRRRLVTVASAAIGLFVSMLGATSASAAPATEGWRAGFCKQGEGLTVVVDFGIGAERDPEARCRVGGTYPSTGDARIDVLESVGYEVAMTDTGLVGYIDGIGNGEPGLGHWWKFSTVDRASSWSADGAFTVPSNAMNWFQGICYSADGCVPRLAPNYEPGGIGPTNPPGPVVPPAPPSITPARTTAVLKVAKMPSSTRSGKARVTIRRAAGRAHPRGKIVVTLTKAKQAKRVRATLPVGRSTVRVTLPRLAKGRWRALVVYQGDALYRRTTTQRVIRVRR